MTDNIDMSQVKDAKYNFDDVYGKKIKPEPIPESPVGIDVTDEFWETLANSTINHIVDMNSINSFSQISQNRETLYQTLDTMAEDPTIAAMLETYTEDATEPNDKGQVVWAESSDSYVGQYVDFLLKSLNIDKNIYKWMYSFLKYGDIYLKLYRQSDFEDKLLSDEQRTQLNEKFTNIDKDEEKENINEDVKVVAYKKNDKLANYVALVPNPAEMFELTRFGKSYAYVKTNTIPTVAQSDTLGFSYKQFTYKLKRRDIEIYNAVSFVHGVLSDNASRMPEEVQIFLDDNLDDENPAGVYTVNRGQSLLYDMYQIWRQLMLLENSLLLNRLTKSAILRVIQVEVADMPKERVGPHLQRIKSLIEQKANIETGNIMQEYTNPGAMENNIYVPTKNGVGAISTQQVGGDVNVRDIADIDYFKNKFYAASKIPKQFLGDTDDATGFNGGTSLSIVSSRYAKTIKRIQQAMIYMLTDAVNILLIDRGLDKYVNKFTLKMQPPITQEELDKRDNTSSLIGICDDVMRLTEQIEDPIIKLKMTKSLLSSAISNQEVISYIQDYIDKLKAEAEEQAAAEAEEPGADSGDDFDMDFDFGGGGSSSGGDLDFGDLGGEAESEPMEMGGAEESLPTPNDLGMDMTEV